jgi:hypothetical protein
VRRNIGAEPASGNGGNIKKGSLRGKIALIAGLALRGKITDDAQTNPNDTPQRTEEAPDAEE